MFTTRHKTVIPRFVLVLLFVTTILGVTPIQAKANLHPEMLSEGSTRNLAGNISAPFQSRGRDFQFDPNPDSVFSPLARNATSLLASTSFGNWSALGSNPAGTDGALSHPSYPTVFDIATSGTDVYVAGCFVNAGGDPTADYVAKWDTLTETWSGLGNDGANPPDGALKGCVALGALAVDGTDVYVGGYPNAWIGGAPAPQAKYLAKWDALTGSWSGLGDDGAGGSSLDYVVNAIAIDGNDVYVGGRFTDVKNGTTTLTEADYIAKWDALTGNWSALGNNGMGNGALGNSGGVEAIVIMNSDVYVGGRFVVYSGFDMVPNATFLAKWNGTQWSGVGNSGSAYRGPIVDTVYALATDGDNLYAAGSFKDVLNDGTVLTAADHIAKWDGANWSALGSNGSGDGALNEAPIAILTDGTDVYAGGGFTNVNNNGTVLTTADYVAKWDALTGNWSGLGSNGNGDGSLNTYVYSSLGLAGNKLYVGGEFTNVNNNGTVLNTADYIAAYDICTSGPITVQNTNDSGPGSLRQAIADICSGGTINFAPSLSGQTISLISNLVVYKSLTIDGSGLSPQVAISGGNISHLEVPYGVAVTISDVTITNCYYGILSNGDLTIINSTLKDNFNYSGGAVSSYNGSLTIKSSTITQNHSAYGGGAISMSELASAKIVNSTIVGNQADDRGGGISINGNGTIEIVNSTFAGNSAPTGSEISIIGNSSTLVVSNTVFACAPANSSCYAYPPGSVESTNSIIGVGTLADFGLAVLSDNGGPTQTIALLPSSSLIDAGNDTLCANSPVNNLDQRGVKRPQGSHCDIGAYEYDAESAEINVTIGEDLMGSYTLARGEERREYYPVSGGPVKVQSTNAVDMVSAIRLQSFANDTLYSFVETMGVPVGLLSHKYYFPTYNNTWGPLNSQLRFANINDTPIDVKVSIGSDSWTYPVLAHAERREYLPVSGGPVVVESLDTTKKIIAAIRLQSFANNTLYSFSETMGIPMEKLSYAYSFPTYNNTWAPLNSQLRVANLDATATTIRVTIGSTIVWEQSVAGRTEQRLYFDVSGGPVKVESLDTSKKIVAAIRLQSFANNTLYSFVETMGVPAGLLSHKYYFPTYNNTWAPLNSQIRFANLESTTTRIRVTIGGNIVWEEDVPGLEERRLYFPVSGGPVIIESLDTSKKIVAAIRLQSYANNVPYSFSETLGIPAAQLSDTYYFPTYNNTWAPLNSQLRFGVP